MSNKSSFESPFLRRIQIQAAFARGKPALQIPAFSKPLTINLGAPVTFVVGENGSGKSTLLKAIAAQCGFNLAGGSQNHHYGDPHLRESSHSLCMRLTWLPRMRSGFYFRAENFVNFATYLDDLEEEDPGLFGHYGGNSLNRQSHGEAFLSLFKYSFSRKGIYLLDEPESALSPKNQLAFLALLHELQSGRVSQFIIATHSPMLLTFPGADIFSLDGQPRKLKYQQTEPFQLMKAFLDKPERFYKHLFSGQN
jgi:predicted ATPase